MRAGMHIEGKGVAFILMIAALVFVPLPACGGGSSDGGGGGGGDTTPPTVSATPSGGINGVAVNVALSATDDQDPAPSIYYTIDASIPTTASTLYTGPINISMDTVLKFFAVDATGNESSVTTEGYLFAVSGIEMEWAASGHAALEGEPFRHWDEDGEVSDRCARCHTPTGFADWAEDGVVDAAAPITINLDCSTCHAAGGTRWDDMTNLALEPVTFPSGATVSLNGPSNMCMGCHQGRSSTDTVDAAIVANPDGPYNFINIHYYAAAASFFGSETRGGYQYEGMEYRPRNSFPSHPASLSSCVGCHMRGAEKDHHFVPEVSDCTGCHGGTSFETLGGSPSMNHDAIETTVGELYAQIQLYASTTIGTGVVYDSGSYPYWFIDTNGNGTADAGEVSYGNRFNLFDGKLLKAAYNYQVALKDPAGFVHNGIYIRQLIHDSIVDLGGMPSIPAPGRAGFDGDAASKAAQWALSGHADAAGEPFRHWDEDGEVSASCARCHSTPGFIDYVADGMVDGPAPLGTTVECLACHQSPNLFASTATRWAGQDMAGSGPLVDVVFPSGATFDFGNDSNMCATCHQGRESGVSVDAKSPNSVAQTPVDYDSFDFVNRHYYAAGAILLGSDVTAAYEWMGQTYKGQNMYSVAHGARTDCFGCHMRSAADHRFLPQLSDCNGCHSGIANFEELGLPFGIPNVDYDGDGTGESFQDEIDGMAANLLAAIQTYATTMLPNVSPVIYDGHAYPYWFMDDNGNGTVDEGEATFTNRYRDFDRTMLRAAFNYHAAQDPCGDMHNYKYTLQTLYDAIDILDDGMFNGSPAGIRP